MSRWETGRGGGALLLSFCFKMEAQRLEFERESFLMRSPDTGVPSSQGPLSFFCGFLNLFIKKKKNVQESFKMCTTGSYVHPLDSDLQSRFTIFSPPLCPPPRTLTCTPYSIPSISEPEGVHKMLCSVFSPSLDDAVPRLNSDLNSP